jgi:hypothetical protein
MRFAARGIFVLALLFTPYMLFAAQPAIPGMGETLTLEVEPRTIIESGSEVTISARSFLIDLDRAAIAWVVNGTRVETADGEKVFKTKVGSIGSETKVTMLVEGANGLSAAPEVVLRPVELELQWESDGYTPPLYRGRTLASPGSTIISQAEVRFVRSNGTHILPQDIVYSWSLNGRALGDVSGRGKSSARIPVTELYGDAIISVDATSLDSVFHAARSARVPQVEPHIMLYRAHPLLGLDYHNAIAAQSVFTDSEVTVAALPYFSSGNGPFDKGLSYVWMVEGKKVPTDATNPFLLTLSLVEKTFGSTVIGVVLQNTYNTLQTTEQRWSVGLNTEPVLDSANPFFDTSQ